MPINFSRPIPHGANRLHTASPLPRRRPRRPPGLAIGTLNIRDGRDFGLAQAIWVLVRGGFDVMLLTKTKIQSEACLHNRLVYDVTYSAVWPSSAGGAQGGVGLVIMERSDG